MVKYFLYLFLFISNIYSDIDLEYIGLAKRRLEPSKSNSQERDLDTRNSVQAFVIGAQFREFKNKLEYDLDFKLSKKFQENKNQDILFLGRNLYFQIPFSNNGKIFLGRKSFNPTAYSQKLANDGTEGIGIEYKANENCNLNFFVFDFYRGYPLFEKNFFKEKVQSSKTQILRQGTSIEFKYKSIESKFEFLYLNFFNTGTFANEEKSKTGDRDFLYQASFNLFWKSSYFITGFNLNIQRGLDKTFFQPSTRQRALPISGELLEFFLTSYINRLQIKSSFFIPDTDKRNSASEVIQIGYIGLGNHPSNSFLTNQDINFFPSAWITESGLEKTFSIQNGRWNSIWSSLAFIYKFANWKILIQGDYYLPRTNQGSSLGEISFSSKDYTKSFITEGKLNLEYGNRDLKHYILLSVSHLTTSRDIYIESSSILISGGIWL
jgi:hypothetical protein